MIRIPALFLFACVLSACGADPAPTKAPDVVAEVVAEVVSEVITYSHGDTELKGYLAYDKNHVGKQPGVLVIHEWWGLQDHPRERARRLAGLGYVAFCADMYGDGQTTDDPKKAGELAGAFYNDRAGHGRARVGAALDILKNHERVDPARLGAIGFCYGGSVVLEMAYAGMPLKGVVCFHGNLITPAEPEGVRVPTAILVCNGAADAWVGPDKVKAWQKAMASRGIDHSLKSYEGAVHAFTNPGADKRGMDNVAYHKAADQQSFEAMEAFFKVHLAP